MNSSEKELWAALEDAGLMREPEVKRIYEQIKRNEGIMSWLYALVPFVLLVALLVAVGLKAAKAERGAQMREALRKEMKA